MESNPVLQFSLIIPARNEENYLPRLLDSVDIARMNYHRGSDAVEVIVSDNCSTDKTAEIAESRGCVVVKEEKRIIAAVRNAGAAAATGEIICFLDADSQIHPDTFNAVDQVISGGKVVGGSTGVTLDRMTLGIALTYYLVMLPMILVTGMDTGVVFCRRADFIQLGGYNEQKLFAEDVDFIVRLKLLGRKRKQKLIRLTSARAVASMRKFKQHGNWHYFPLMMRGVYAMFLPSERFEKFARKYWYDDRQT
ncbi:glycosyl transferase family 2 [Candidatus Fermentibacteria bacterium]|nr:MAG: glycosyl transferase family 2 [Candidatus Fermentibacteria bacterium]